MSAPLLIGQSLELSHRRHLLAVRRRDASPLLAQVTEQRRAGAEAIDLNAGGAADAADLAWCVRVLRAADPGLPLLVDSASPRVIAEALAACARDGVPGSLVANSLPAGADGAPAPDAAILIEVAVSTGAGVVISPRLVDLREHRASAAAVARAAIAGATRLRGRGVTGPIMLDALAFPPLADPRRCARSLATLRALREAGAPEAPGVATLTAVGNVGYGAAPALAAALRAVYAAAATGAGAGALILPVEETETMRAVEIACGTAEPRDAEERWLREAGAAAGTGSAPPPAPARYAEAARLVFAGAT